MQDRVAGRVALLAGASGLVGREILAAILADESYVAVHGVGRRALKIDHSKLTSHVVDFAALPTLPACDDAFIALGTTIKAAGSRPAFRAVDFDAVLALAEATRSSGAARLGIVSAMGASDAFKVETMTASTAGSCSAIVWSVIARQPGAVSARLAARAASR